MLIFDLTHYTVRLCTITNQLTLIPKDSKNIPVLCDRLYAVPGILGPDFEINIHDLILKTQEEAKDDARKGF